MKTWLLSLLLLATAAEANAFQVQVSRHNDTLTFSVPEPPEGQHYTAVWVTIGQTVFDDLESPSQNLYQLAADGYSGTFSIALCGEGDVCHLEEVEWSVSRPLPWMLCYGLLGIICSLIYIFYATSQEVKLWN